MTPRRGSTTLLEGSLGEACSLQGSVSARQRVGKALKSVWETRVLNCVWKILLITQELIALPEAVDGNSPSVTYDENMNRHSRPVIYVIAACRRRSNLVLCSRGHAN